ncbi:MAG: Bifunctional non-ous end joining protein LigD [Pseudonocardiales bacterium]|jgi:bifunctional non-homologous end joining protein LigD|nr:Bifunctional non-ous end joining protein LigD [Pseudonocardiales bacterium]
MLATAVTQLPTEPGWAFEFKWDGVRALIDVSDQGVIIRSRAGNDVTAAYPELVALASDVEDALLDGEIVAFDAGAPSFELLQSRMHVRSAVEARRLAVDAPVTFVAFELLRRYGIDLSSRPYAERRATLERWAAERPDWTISPVFDDGAATAAAAHEHGLEGVVAKRLDAPYRAGIRSPHWRKLRFVRAGDFVVVGWEAASGSAKELSSLVLGYYGDDGELTFAGKVGSGLSGQAITRLQAALVARADCPLPDPPARTAGRTVHWVQPTVVVEVEFVSWTAEGRLRHPVFRGVRQDKRPDEAVGDG